MPRGGPRDTRRILIAAGRMHAPAIRFSDVKLAAIKFSTTIERGGVQDFSQRPGIVSRLGDGGEESVPPGRKRFSVSGELDASRYACTRQTDHLNDRIVKQQIAPPKTLTSLSHVRARENLRRSRGIRSPIKREINCTSALCVTDITSRRISAHIRASPGMPACDRHKVSVKILTSQERLGARLNRAPRRFRQEGCLVAGASAFVTL